MAKKNFHIGLYRSRDDRIVYQDVSASNRNSAIRTARANLENAEVSDSKGEATFVTATKMKPLLKADKDFVSAAKERAKRDGSSMRAAMLQVAKENPGLHKEYVAAQREDARRERAKSVDSQKAANGSASGFMEMSRARAKKDGSSMRNAMLAVTKENPEVHAAWVQNQKKR